MLARLVLASGKGSAYTAYMAEEKQTAEEIIDVLWALDPLADLPRAGWLLRGVAAPESVAEHCFGVAVVAALLVDALRAEGQTLDGEKVLRMALIHDAAESGTGDLPMPNKTPALRAALAEQEQNIVAKILPPAWAEHWNEAENGQSLEAQLVHAADKIQMMIKVLVYERRRGASLAEFWANPANFRDGGLSIARAIYRALCARAERDYPGEG